MNIFYDNALFMSLSVCILLYIIDRNGNNDLAMECRISLRLRIRPSWRYINLLTIQKLHVHRWSIWESYLLRSQMMAVPSRLALTRMLNGLQTWRVEMAPVWPNRLRRRSNTCKDSSYITRWWADVKNRVDELRTQKWISKLFIPWNSLIIKDYNKTSGHQNGVEILLTTAIQHLRIYGRREFKINARKMLLLENNHRVQVTVSHGRISMNTEPPELPLPTSDTVLTNIPTHTSTTELLRTHISTKEMMTTYLQTPNWNHHMRV